MKPDQERRMAEEIFNAAFNDWYGKGEGLGAHSKTAIEAAFKTGITAALVKVTQGQEPLLENCEIDARPLRYSLRDYHRAMTEGPLNFTWQDKPHRLVYDLIAAVKYYAHPIPSQQEERVRELEDAIEVIRAIDAGGWKITRHQAWSSLTDEANALFAWSVERTEAPYCDGNGYRRWVGPTAVAALRAGKAAIDGTRNKEQGK